MKGSHLDLSDAVFIEHFRSCKLAEELFNHEAHLRLAWIHLRKFEENEAVRQVVTDIQRYVSHLGAEDVYHHTLTVGATKAVSHFVQRSDEKSFIGFIKEFPQLKANFKELMASHYSFDLFQSAQAKSEYIEPDLIPFD